MLKKLMELLLILGLCVNVFTSGSDGAITIGPRNTAVLVGTQKVVMYCTSDGNQMLSWAYYPVGGSYFVDIASGSTVYDPQSYAVETSGSKQSNLTILSATMTRAGIYNCFQGLTQQATAQLIVIGSDPVCSMIPNSPTELLYNQTVQMNCRFSYTANTSYIAVDMSWSKGSLANNVTSSPPQISTNANLTTAISTITQIPGNFTPFPIYSCKTSFRITGSPPSGSAVNPPDYVKSTPLCNSPINVIYLKPAYESSVIGATTGGSVYLGTNVTCSVEANPPPSYSWLDITYGNRTNSLSVQIWHSGEYQCTGWNKAASTSVSVNITTYTTTTTSTTTTTPTTTVTSRSSGISGPSGTDTTAPTSGSSTGNGGLSDGGKIGIGVGIGIGGSIIVGGTLLYVMFLRYRCIKKTKTDDQTPVGLQGVKLEDPERSQNTGDGSNISKILNYEPLDVHSAQNSNIGRTYEQLTTMANVDEQNPSNKTTYENFEPMSKAKESLSAEYQSLQLREPQETDEYEIIKHKA